jgi:hypothetical protein
MTEKPYIISLPTKFDQDSLFPFFRELSNVQMEKVVTVDFSSLSYSYPLAMLVAGSYLRQWRANRVNNNLTTKYRGINDSNSTHTYLQHLGFFQFIGINSGKAIGEAKGSNTYLPIRKIIRSELEETAKQCKQELRKVIDFQSGSLANVLFGSTSKIQDIKTYTYAIRETLRNVFEHSGANECFICGQSWSNGQSEIAVIDEGIGIYETIKIAYDISNDEEALKLAIKPGITRTKLLSKEENIYDNSGYGLYVLSHLGSSFGYFIIGSGLSKIRYKSQKIHTESFDFKGTFIGVHLDKTPSDFRGLLNDIILEGEKETSEMGEIISASTASKLLSLSNDQDNISENLNIIQSNLE